MRRLVGIPPPVIIWAVFVAIIYLANGDSDLLLDHNGLETAEGTKHLDLFDKEDHSLHGSKILDNKGKDKSKTTTQAMLQATLKAKDKHEDSYSHLHDNAHETDFGTDHDVLLGDELVAEHENDDEGVDYIDAGEYVYEEYPHEDHTAGFDEYHVPGNVVYDDEDERHGHVQHSPMVHAGVHGSVHPSVHRRHIPVNTHHQAMVDGGGFVPGMHHADIRYGPEHGFAATPDHNVVGHVGAMPHSHPHARRRYIVRPAQPSFVQHSDLPWAAAGGFH